MRQIAECKECKCSFERLRSTQLFCCDQHRSDYHNRQKLEKAKFADENGFVDESKLAGPDYFKA